MSWLFIEKVHVIQKGERVLATAKTPTMPYSPEVLFIEMMAQAGSLLIAAENDFQDDLMFAKIDQATFHALPEKEASLEIEVDSDDLKSEGAWLKGRIHAGDQLMAESRFLLLNVGRLVPEKESSVIFHSNYMEQFQLRERVRVA